jgi:hypothetical protein
MLRKSPGQFIRVIATLMMVLAIGGAAQAQPTTASQAAAIASITGRNVMSVGVGQDRVRTGEIRRTEEKTWVETDLSGKVVARFQEVKRDDNSVYLADRLRGVTVQLDLKTRLATYVEKSTRRTDLFEIQAVANNAEPLPKENTSDDGPRLTSNFKARQSPNDNSPIPVRVEAPAFCWNDIVMRAAGTVPGRLADCPPGLTKDGNSCKKPGETIASPSRAADCPAGYNLSGTSCERAATTKANTNSRPADCPPQFENTGEACFRLSAPAPLSMDVMTCKGGEQKIGSRCYRACETGFTNAGTTCTRPVSTVGADKMTCKAGFKKAADAHRCVAECAAGFTSSGDSCVRPAQTLGLESMTCKAGETRNGDRCVTAGTGCAKGEVLQGGLCFAACAPGYDGVGTTCVAQPPKTWGQCGIGSAKTPAACAAPAFDQVTSVKQLAVFVGVLAGADRATAPAQRTAQAAALQKKYKEMNDAYAKAKDLPEVKKGYDAWQQANGGNVSLDKMAAATSEADMLRYAAHLLSIVELSGGANVSAAYPQCSKVATK